MHFKKYKITDELLEIYSRSEDSFSVGRILSKDEDSIFIRAYDEQGGNDGFHYMKSKFVTALEKDTDYLKKMNLYIEYMEKKGIKEPENPFKDHPQMKEVLDFAVERNEIITVLLYKDPDELITGYITGYEDGKIEINCVDIETAETFEKVIADEKDVCYIEVLSMDNELLKYANERIEESK